MNCSPKVKLPPGIPPRGEVWPDSRLLAATGAQVGSSLAIGAATFRVGHVLISLPDQGGTFAELAPSLFMNLHDLPATQLIQPGSRVSYSVLFAGDRGLIDDFKSWLLLNKKPAERLRDIRDASPQIKSATERAGRFLSLASLVSVLLCAIAIAMSARRYVHRRLDVVALMKTLGATSAFTLSVSLLQLACNRLCGGGGRVWRGLHRTGMAPAGAQGAVQYAASAG